MNLSDIEFDHDADCVKHRAMGEGVTYEQNGVLFSSGFVPLKIVKILPPKDEFDDMSPAELRNALRDNSIASPQKKKKKKVGLKQEEASGKVHSARQRADDKLAGFRTPNQPDYIQQALSENHAAVMAEEKAE